MRLHSVKLLFQKMKTMTEICHFCILIQELMLQLPDPLNKICICLAQLIVLSCYDETLIDETHRWSLIELLFSRRCRHHDLWLRGKVWLWSALLKGRAARVLHDRAQSIMLLLMIVIVNLKLVLFLLVKLSQQPPQRFNLLQILQIMLLIPLMLLRLCVIPCIFVIIDHIDIVDVECD